ncbi:hypothetical protein [Rugamonas sp.]|uniref:hypothetical protein n=1 Tax=Rugamonas sp. TaxID=1926287 RepID=UPI0025D7BC72|nr:hypothetical protein [Rugamonas sp.]
MIASMMAAWRRTPYSSRVKAGLVALLLLALSLSMGQVERINNGDGWRTLRSAQVASDHGYAAFAPFPRYFTFRPSAEIGMVDLIPMSSTGALVQTWAGVQRALGAEQFDFRWLSLTYLALYLGGILLIMLELHWAAGTALLLLLLNPYILAYFNSAYEESLVIALAPLLVYCALRDGTAVRRGSRALALLITASKVQFLPMMLSGLRRARWQHNAGFLLLALLLGGGIAVKGSKFSIPNGYNRYFNGLAYSMAGVSSWPARDFSGRAALAASRIDPATVHFPAGSEDARPYWGSSYWPTGAALAQPQQDLLGTHLRAWFWSTLLANPQYAYRIVSEPITTAAGADYRMDYLFRSTLPAPLLAPYGVLMRYWGALALLASTLSLLAALRARQVRYALYSLFLLGYPWLVVYGDGYFEFEKHLFPITLLGVLFPLARLLMRRPPTPAVAPAR